MLHIFFCTSFFSRVVEDERENNKKASWRHTRCRKERWITFCLTKRKRLAFLGHEATSGGSSHLHTTMLSSPHFCSQKFPQRCRAVLEAKKKTRMRQERDQFRELHSFFTIPQQEKQIDYSAMQNTEGRNLVWKHVRKEAKNLRSESKQWQQCSLVPAVCVQGLRRTYLASRDHFDQRETALGSYADGDPAAETTTTTTQAGSGDTLPPPSYRLFRRRLSSSSAAASTFCLIADSCSSSSCFPASCSYFRCYKDNAGPSRMECRRRVAGRWTWDLHEARTRTEYLLYQILGADERLVGKTWSRRLSSG